MRQFVFDVVAMTGDSDHFARLGLPRRFSLDAAELERQYLDRSRAVHPDLAGDSPGSLDGSARLNQAYAVLKEPARRADYLLQLMGGPGPTEVSQAPAEFLEEMLDLRMAIAEASDATSRSELEKSLSLRRTALLDEINPLFDEPTALRRIRELLNALKFIDGLLRDLNGD